MNGLEGVHQITRQMISLLERIPQSSYSRMLDIYDGSTIGKHFRHIFDFYRCLEAGLKAGQIDYSSRQRNQQLEEDPQVIARYFRDVAKQLNGYSMDTPLQVLSDFSCETEAGREYFDSTFGRELAFIHDHAVHHLAIIKMGLKQVEPAMNPGQEFGVAPSTIKYQREQ